MKRMALGGKYSDPNDLAEVRERIRLISEIDILDHWTAFSSELVELVNKIDIQIENHAQFSDEFKKDIRYLLGRRSAFKDVLALPSKKKGQNNGGE